MARIKRMTQQTKELILLGKDINQNMLGRNKNELGNNASTKRFEDDTIVTMDSSEETSSGNGDDLEQRNSGFSAYETLSITLLEPDEEESDEKEENLPTWEQKWLH